MKRTKAGDKRLSVMLLHRKTTINSEKMLSNPQSLSLAVSFPWIFTVVWLSLQLGSVLDGELSLFLSVSIEWDYQIQNKSEKPLRDL